MPLVSRITVETSEIRRRLMIATDTLADAKKAFEDAEMEFREAQAIHQYLVKNKIESNGEKATNPEPPNYENMTVWEASQAVLLGRKKPTRTERIASILQKSGYKKDYENLPMQAYTAMKRKADIFVLSAPNTWGLRVWELEEGEENETE